MWRGYVGMINLALTAPQRGTLAASLGALGPANDPQPCNRNHRRVRLDGDAIIFEAAFADDDLTVVKLRGYLANVFGVPVAQISASTASQTFGTLPTPVVTLTYQATQRLRVALFAGTTATWEQSRAEVLAYLAANLAAWQEDV